MSVVLYCRVSTNSQETGLESQIRALEAYCSQRGISNYELITDSGVSGAKEERPGLNRLMELVHSKQASKIIVYSFSRFSRSTSHLLRTLELFRELNVDFVSITESLDTGTPIGRAMFSIIASINALERDILRERVINGLKNCRAKGIKLGAKKKFTNKELFLQLSQQGLSQRQIAKLVGCSVATVCRELKIVSQTPKSA